MIFRTSSRERRYRQSGYIPTKREQIALVIGRAEAVAMHTLTESDYAIVYAIAYREFRSIRDKQDLIGDGMVGLVEAANRYDPTFGVPFAHYAGRRVRGAIKDGLRRMDWLKRQECNQGYAERIETRAIFMHSMRKRQDPFSFPEFLTLAADKLPPKEWAVVRMRYLEGKDTNEIGSVLGVHCTWVSTIHSRALQRLRAMVSNPRSQT